MSTTFTWVLDYGAAATRQPHVKTVKFGDGYEQRFADGLNPLAEVWNLSFSNRDAAEGAAIDAFLVTNGGTIAFTWTPPGGSAGKYVCRQWQKTIEQGNLWTITASFEQVFEA